VKGLIIDEPWISLIVSGEKTWEMRSRNTNVRGRIGLIRKGSKTVIRFGNRYATSFSVVHTLPI
jgi:ASCH domain